MEMTLLKKLDGSYVPFGDDSIEASKKVKGGRLIVAQVRQPRNYEFHKKWFALVQFAFDIWTETCPMLEYKGQRVQPNLNRFRKDLTILAGYYEPVFDMNGELRLQALSISFGSMDQEDFEKLYSATINAILGKVLANRGLSADDVRSHVDRVMQFDH